MMVLLMKEVLLKVDLLKEVHVVGLVQPFNVYL
jgi:hypothetical protein